MSALTLRLRRPPARRVDLAPLVPNLLAGMNTRQIARIELWHGNQKVPVGDLFTLHGDSVERIVIQSDSDRLDRIGASMTASMPCPLLALTSRASSMLIARMSSI